MKQIASLFCWVCLIFMHSLSAQTPTPAPTTIRFTLPDQIPLHATAMPPLQHRKLSVLTLSPEKSSPWRVIAFTADMPEHKHGMVVEPKLSAGTGGDANVRIQGVKLHMAGTWQIKVQVQHQQSGEKRWLTQSLTLAP